MRPTRIAAAALLACTLSSCPTLQHATRVPEMSEVEYIAYRDNAVATARDAAHVALERGLTIEDLEQIAVAVRSLALGQIPEDGIVAAIGLDDDSVEAFALRQFLRDLNYRLASYGSPLGPRGEEILRAVAEAWLEMVHPDA